MSTNKYEEFKIKKETIDNLYSKIWAIRGSLNGVGALLQQQSNSPCYEADELFGLGQFMKFSADELDEIEDILRSGH